MSSHALRRSALELDPEHGAPSPDAAPRTNGPDAAAQFVARLREQREQRQVSIATIAETTKILPALLEGLENGDVTRWPSGLYRRSFIRAYAAGIGLDPEPIVREFLQHFPDPEEGAASGLPPTPPPTSATPRAALRLTFPEGLAPGPPVIEELRWRAAAVAVDGFVIVVTGVLIYSAMDVLWAPLSLIGAVYFLGGVLLFGTTPGIVMVGASPRSPSSRTRVGARWLTRLSDRPRPE